jgi:2-dehydropantoate 2-reductase
MKIIIFGAGAIGSLFGGFLSKNHNVILIGRKDHVYTINKKGLRIEGKSKLKVKINAVESINKVTFYPDLLIITVKSYDTETAIIQAKKIISENTIILSLQNGLDNVDKIKKYVPLKNLIVGVTTHGAFFSKPGLIKHTGIGLTTLGALEGLGKNNVKKVDKIFNASKIKTKVSNDILKEIWIKTIVNSSINPITTIFQCKNGYLFENPVLEKIVEKVCEESSKIAKVKGINVSYSNMIKRTKDVIKSTSENYSSMLQSIKNHKKTEINSINGKLVEIGKKYNTDTFLNEILIYMIKSEELK